ncbi:MAG: ABC transporter permease [Clostridiaceae bacterium]|jgi:ABC-2 type transport system permease protein|nr:ABC transporter permease [Clostridiaceae bacterium]
MREIFTGLKQKLSRVISLVKKEFIIIWKDPKSRGMIVGLPLIQLLIFANAITMEVTNIDMAVLDRANTTESRELISKFDDSTRFRKIIYVNNENDIKNLIANQKVQIALEIQNDFSNSIKAKRPTYIQIIADGRQTNSASIASAYASQIIGEYSNFVVPQKSVSINSVIRNWYNPNLNYRWFIMQTMVVLLALVITLLLTALSIAREKENGTFDQLVVSPLSSGEILIGKTIPPLFISLALTTIMTIIVTIFFDVPLVGSKLLLLLLFVSALLSIVGVGLFISSICKTQQQAILGVMTFQIPAVLLSGFVSPIEDMPKIAQFITLFNPLRYFLSTTRGIFFKDMAVQDVMTNILPLLFIAMITLSIASWTFKRKLD